MQAVGKGATGVAVEDIQDRLVALGYAMSPVERRHKEYGATTAEAVMNFRADQGLPAGDEVDGATWSALVDAGYHMGDRTLYLRLPNFHGNDVHTLQNALNVLGFPAGPADSYFGAKTEAAVKQFQENVGLMPDGMCFQDTFQAIWRLYHVWGDKEADEAPSGESGLGFARAASVLEKNAIAVSAADPIARNVAGRIWNLASATTENSGLVLLNAPYEASPELTVLFELVSELPEPEPGVAQVSMDACGDDFPRRLRTGFAASRHKPPYVRIQLPEHARAYDGSFTSAQAQITAGVILDAICTAFQ